MTNFEYYAKNDTDRFFNFLSLSTGLAVCLENNKEVLVSCTSVNCSNCLFGSRVCGEARKEWLLSEHKSDVETSNNEGGISW